MDIICCAGRGKKDKCGGGGGKGGKCQMMMMGMIMMVKMKLIGIILFKKIFFLCSLVASDVYFYYSNIIYIFIFCKFFYKYRIEISYCIIK